MLFNLTADKIRELKAAKREEIELFLAEIGVTEAQRAELKAVREAAKAELKPLWNNLREERKALLAYLASPEADESEFMSRTAKAEHMKQQLKQAYIHSVFKAKRILTPEQQGRCAERLQAKIQAFEEKVAELKAAS